MWDNFWCENESPPEISYAGYYTYLISRDYIGDLHPVEPLKSGVGTTDEPLGSELADEVNCIDDNPEVLSEIHSLDVNIDERRTVRTAPEPLIVIERMTYLNDNMYRKVVTNQLRSVTR